MSTLSKGSCLCIIEDMLHLSDRWIRDGILSNRSQDKSQWGKGKETYLHGYSELCPLYQTVWLCCFFEILSQSWFMRPKTSPSLMESRAKKKVDTHPHHEDPQYLMDCNATGIWVNYLSKVLQEWAMIQSDRGVASTTFSCKWSANKVLCGTKSCIPHGPLIC